MKFKAVFLTSAISVPGTTVVGRGEIIPHKHEGLTIELVGNMLACSQRGIDFVIPLSNVSFMIVEKAPKTPAK